MELLFVCVLLACTAAAQPHVAQSDTPPDWNIPRDVWDRFKAEKLDQTYEISRKLNPFYLRGDFDGDGIPDYAVLVFNRNTRTMGIAVMRSHARRIEVVGAGGTKLRVAALPDGSPAHWLEDFSGFDAWHVARKEPLKPTSWDTPVSQMSGEGIVVEKTEASAGLIYWDGKQYHWLQISN